MSSGSQVLPCVPLPASACDVPSQLLLVQVPFPHDFHVPSWSLKKLQCCLLYSFFWTTHVVCIQLTHSPSRVRSLRQACFVAHSVLRVKAACLPDPCGQRWHWFPVHLPLRVQPCGDADPLSLGGPRLCPLSSAPQETVNTEAGIHLGGQCGTNENFFCLHLWLPTLT